MNTPLTEERFQQILDEQFTKQLAPLVTKKELTSSEARIIKRIDEAQEELARMTSRGFEDVLDRLDVREEMKTIKTELKELRELKVEVEKLKLHLAS